MTYERTRVQTMTAKVKLGISTSGDLDALERRVFGNDTDHFPAHRSYHGDMPATLNSSDLTRDMENDVISVVSVKPGKWRELDRIIPLVRSQLQSVDPEHDVRYVIQHEPEENASDTVGNHEGPPLGTMADFRTLNIAVRPVVDEINADRDKAHRIRFWLNLMAFSTGTTNAEDLYPGDGVVDGIAWDGYAWNGKAYRDAEDIFDQDLAFCQQRDVAFAINETGVGSDHHVRAEEWVNNFHAWVRRPDVPARWAVYWAGGEQFTLPPGSPAEAALKP